jgi:hypothetical protein
MFFDTIVSVSNAQSPVATDMPTPMPAPAAGKTFT